VGEGGGGWGGFLSFRAGKKTPTLSKPVFLPLKVHDKEHGAANENTLHRNPKLGVESCIAASYN
jgi:hypothetical protein